MLLYFLGPNVAKFAGVVGPSVVAVASLGLMGDSFVLCLGVPELVVDLIVVEEREVVFVAFRHFSIVCFVVFDVAVFHHLPQLQPTVFSVCRIWVFLLVFLP